MVWAGTGDHPSHSRLRFYSTAVGQQPLKTLNTIKADLWHLKPLNQTKLGQVKITCRRKKPTSLIQISWVKLKLGSGTVRTPLQWGETRCTCMARKCVIKVMLTFSNNKLINQKNKCWLQYQYKVFSVFYLFKHCSNIIPNRCWTLLSPWLFFYDYKWIQTSCWVQKKASLGNRH